MPRLLFGLLTLLFSAQLSAYSVKNGQITDEQHRSVQLRGINWFGFETDILIAHGLWARNYVELIEQMQAAGINAVRLPLCPAAIHGGKVGGLDTQLNPELAGKDSLQVLDALIAQLDAHGMYVLLDHHRPDCQAQSPLWYTDSYSETQWLADLLSLATRYKDVPHVIGIDLKNEPHGSATWGSGDKTTDFNLAAERAGAAVLAVAPRWLLFVEGIGHGSACTPQAAQFWGENLEPLTCTALKLPRNKVVLSPHVYGPDIAAMPYFSDPSFPANMPAIWDAHFGQLALRGYAVVPGEFGGGYGHCGTAADRVWQDAFAQYLVSRGMTSAFYWSLNPNSDQTGGLLQTGWKTFWPDKLALLQHLFSKGLQPLPPPMPGAADGGSCTNVKPSMPTVPPVAGPGPSDGGGHDIGRFTLKALGKRGEADCNEVEVLNAEGSPIRWQIQVPVAGRVVSVNSAVIETAARGSAWARGLGSNATLTPGERLHFSYCVATDTTAASKPEAAVKVTQPEAAVSAAKLLSVASRIEGSEGFLYESSTDSEWEKGYCSRVQVRNTGKQAAAWKAVFTVRGPIRQFWKARYTQSGNTVTASGEDYNRVLKQGEATDFGFCAAK